MTAAPRLPRRLLGVGLTWREDGAGSRGKKGDIEVFVYRAHEHWAAAAYIEWAPDHKVTIFASAPTPQAAAAKLRRRVARLREALR